MSDRTETALRIKAEWDCIKSLAQSNTLLTAKDVTGIAERDGGDGPHRVELIYTGKGIAHAGPNANVTNVTDRNDANANDANVVEFGQQHQVTLEFSADFPAQAPSVQIVSLLFHPNVPSGGSIDLNDIGLYWQPALTSDVICERIWDIIRGAYIDLENAANPAAAKWYSLQTGVSMPVDSRVIEESALRSQMKNVIRYHRRVGAVIAPNSSVWGGALEDAVRSYDQTSRPGSKDGDGVHYIS